MADAVAGRRRRTNLRPSRRCQGRSSSRRRARPPLCGAARIPRVALRRQTAQWRRRRGSRQRRVRSADLWVRTGMRRGIRPHGDALHRPGCCTTVHRRVNRRGFRPSRARSATRCGALSCRLRRATEMPSLIDRNIGKFAIRRWKCPPTAGISHSLREMSRPRREGEAAHRVVRDLRHSGSLFRLRVTSNTWV